MCCKKQSKILWMAQYLRAHVAHYTMAGNNKPTCIDLCRSNYKEILLIVTIDSKYVPHYK